MSSRKANQLNHIFDISISIIQNKISQIAHENSILHISIQYQKFDLSACFFNLFSQASQRDSLIITHRYIYFCIKSTCIAINNATTMHIFLFFPILVFFICCYIHFYKLNELNFCWFRFIQIDQFYFSSTFKIVAVKFL